MKTIYYDITHLVGWKGGLTGIPRTTDEIARRLRKLSNAKFISWDVVRRCFVEIDIEDYYTNIEPVNRAFYKNLNTNNANSDTPSSFNLKRAILKTPVIGRSAAKLNRELKRNIKKYTQEAGSSLLKINPSKGDLVFIPCGVWDDQNYINTLVSYKADGVKLAFISYDLLPIVVPQFSGQWGKPMEDFTLQVTSICDVVFSISEYTKKDLSAWLKGKKKNVPNIEVIKLGDTYNLSKPQAPKQKEFLKSGILDSKSDFILCVGTVESRKNHTLLYYVYKLAKSRGVKLPKLVIAGRPGHRTENIIDIIKDDPEVNSDIVMLFNTDDHELSWLYQNCRFTVYPSFYEGWGLPIAESIANGVPCVCSNTSSMTEVAPGFVEYFNPCSADECLNAMIKYMDDPTYQKAKLKTKKYEPVSWDDTYDEVEKALLAVDRNILGDK